MYTFRQIRQAICAVDMPPTDFPYGIPVIPEQFTQLRSEPHLQDFIADIRLEAERAQTTDFPHLPFRLFQMFDADGSRQEYDELYADRRRRLGVMALTALLDTTDTTIGTLEEMIWAICNEYTWALPAHLPIGMEAKQAHRLPPEQMVSLMAAETACALAEILRLLGDQLHPFIAYRVRQEIERRVFAPLFNTSIHFGWEDTAMNWSAVCMGATGIAALILEQNSERLAGMMERVVRSMECFLEGYGNDGGCAEGINYWAYGFGYYVYFAEALYTYTNGQLDLLQGDKLRAIASFPSHVSLGSGNFINYSDGHMRVQLPTGLISRLATRLQCSVPEIVQVALTRHDNRYRWSHAIRTLLWSNPQSLSQPTPPTTTYLPDLSWGIDRRSFGSTMVAFSAKGGHNDEPHNHNDLGHFILHIGGESLLADLGPGLYTRDYFHGDRYSFLHTSSEGHSVPLIDGHPQRGGRHHTAEVLSYEPEPDGMVFELDLTQAYAVAHLSQLTRRFVWRVDAHHHQAQLTLTDTCLFQNPATFDEVFISFHSPTLDDERIIWHGEHGTITMAYDHTSFKATVETITATAFGGLEQVIYRVRLRAQSRQTQHRCQCLFHVATL